MKQVSQRPRGGEVRVLDVPHPELESDRVLIRNRISLISAGTERSKIELGRKSLVGKARARPDLAKKVIERARVEGIRRAVELARDRLEAAAPVGYSAAGVVVAVGDRVDGIAPGDRVACGGGGWANHAELVSVPRNLVVRLPEGVPFDAAAYATVGSIAVHALRQANAQLGESVGVVGLGLVGQLALRLARAAGCRTLGVDPEEAARLRASAGGAVAYAPGDVSLEGVVAGLTAGRGLDAVLVCAASTGAEPVELATQLVRHRGRIVIVGDVPIRAARDVAYAKELELSVSRSYGPGRYDRDYEEHGRDYPHEYVRWTEGRNMQAFVELLASGMLAVDDLTTHRFPVERADEAYETLLSSVGERAFGVLLEYAEASSISGTVPARSSRPSSPTVPRVAVIGAGAFARSTLIPALRTAGAELTAVASSGGLAAADAAARLGFGRAATTEEIIAADDVDAVVIATRHATHASLVLDVLAAGKPVFVEKPLALSPVELEAVQQALTDESLLMVGFNRRHAPLTERLRELFSGVPGTVFTVRVNAGELPPDHWLHDPDEGGGRLLGEGCHFVDLLLHLASSRVVDADIVAAPQPERPIACSDALAAIFRFDDGSVGSLVYSGAGDTSLSKERIEVFGGGIAAVLDDFRVLDVHRRGRRVRTKEAQDKGHGRELRLFVEAVAGRQLAPPIETYLASTRITLELAERLRRVPQ